MISTTLYLLIAFLLLYCIVWYNCADLLYLSKLSDIALSAGHHGAGLPWLGHRDRDAHGLGGHYGLLRKFLKHKLELSTVVSLCQRSHVSPQNFL